MTISETETYCILKAINYVISNGYSREIWIFSDSQAAIQRISKASNFISNQIRIESNKYHIHLHWCPGHEGIAGNELADNLARGGAKKKVKKRDKFTTIAYLKQKAKELTLKAWQNDWETQVLRQEEGRRAKGLGRLYQVQARKRSPIIKMRQIGRASCRERVYCTV